MIQSHLPAAAADDVLADDVLTDAQRGDALRRFMSRWEPRPFSWDDYHCMSMPAAWVEYIEGRDINVPPVSSALAAAVAVMARGGIVRAISRELRRPPLDRLDLARVGDVVVYRRGVASRRGVVGAVGLVLAPGLVVISSGELASVHPLAEAAAAWGVAR